MSHKNPIVDFLRAYGPSEAANNLFDEHVTSAARAHDIRPFEVESPLLTRLVDNFRDQAARNIVLTGTAGDGKTYLCRKLYETLGGAPEDFRQQGEIATLDIGGRCKVTIIKDLSELRDADKERELEALTRAFLGEDRTNVYLVAANDGQLLKFWRDFSERHPHASTLYKLLRRMLKDEKSEIPDELPWVELYNLSRQPNDQLFEDVVAEVLDPSRWEACNGCPLVEGGPPCPILENRDRLRADEPAVFRKRLKEAIALAAANDLHLPMRQLFLLVANILLGDAASKDMLSCRKAQNRAQNGDYAHTNPYDNALGRNLRESHREIYGVFTTLASLGIGSETNNAIDEMLVEAMPEDLHKRLVATDSIYGDVLIRPARHAYLKGDRDQLESLLTALESQRRRLFFTLEDTPESGRLSPWALTVFRSGGDYLAFQAALKNSESTTQTFRKLVCGLNRTFTGTMTTEKEKVWLAIPPGNVHDRTGRVLEHAPIPRKAPPGAIQAEVDNNGINQRPRFVLKQRGQPNALAAIELRPLLFEYLIRVANGSLPASFSRQCFEELKHFRLRAVQMLSELHNEDPSETDMHLVSLDNRTCQLNSSPLAVEEEE
jgi:hypothetical protein